MYSLFHKDLTPEVVHEASPRPVMFGDTYRLHRHQVVEGMPPVYESPIDADPENPTPVSVVTDAVTALIDSGTPGPINLTKAHLAAVRDIVAPQVQPETTDLITDLTPFENQIDVLAGQRRQSFMADGLLVDQEYLLAAEQADAFKVGGYTGTPPKTVQSWMDAQGLTATQATDHILAQDDFMASELERVRDVRLKKKAELNALVSPTRMDVELVVDSARTALFT